MVEQRWGERRAGWGAEGGDVRDVVKEGRCSSREKLKRAKRGQNK